MRLLCVIDSLGLGGAQHQMVNLAVGLKKRGHDVEFFVYHPEYAHFADSLERGAIPVHAYHKSHRFSLGVVWALRRLTVSERYSGVMSFLPTPSFYSELARIGAPSSVLVVSERSAFPCGRLRLPFWVLQQFHRLADHVTVNSHHQRERMEKLFPWMRGRISTILNGVDLNRFSPRAGGSRGSRGRLELLVVGSTAPTKNAVGLVHGIAAFRQRYGSVPIVRWAGRRVASRGSEGGFAEAVRLVSQLGLGDSWEWLGDRTDIPDLLLSHDALVHPSLLEGLPNAVCEALACGRPVLASNAGDQPRLVQEGVTGFLFDPKDPVDIAMAIHRFSSLSPAKSHSMELPDPA
jgi:glycosyltransferase involved in cell wall biosynthesis